MSQLQRLPLNKQISKSYFKEVHKDLSDAHRILDVLIPGDELNVFDYYTFGMWYSSALADKGRFEDYRQFIHQFNQTVEKTYKEALEFIKEVYLQLHIKVGFHKALNMIRLKISDRLDLFKGDEFARECDFERILMDSLKSWTDEWVIDRQVEVGFGKCDLIIVKGNEQLAIELKKSVATRKDIYQAVEYTKGNSGFDVAIIAKKFPEDVIQLANDLNVVCYEYLLGRYSGVSLYHCIYLERVNEPREPNDIELELEEINRCDGHIIDYSIFPIPKPDEAIKQVRKEIGQFYEDLLIIAEILGATKGGIYH